MTENSLSDQIMNLAQFAVGLARDDYGVDLDFSEASLSQVEEILTNIYKQIPQKGRHRKPSRKGPTPEQLESIALVWGAYVGEVIRRRWGGEWSTHTDAYPEEIITLHVMGHQIFPPTKVYKRLTNGEEDNVQFYYQVFSQEFERAKRFRQT